MADATNPNSEYLDVIKENKDSLFWIGVAMSIIGAIAIVFPILSSVATNFMVGWLFVFYGALMIFNSFTIKGTGPFFGALLFGLITLATGVFFLTNPGIGLVFLTITIAIVFMFDGAYQAVMAFEIKPQNGWGWMLFSAIISVLAGLFIIARLPDSSLVVLGILIGVNFLSSGLSMIFLSRSVDRTASQ